MPFKPIESYGVIGNMHTAALVGMDGSLDWLCFPHFDSPSVFASILDDEKGGFFRISPSDPDSANKQFYWPETNVLTTHFALPEGVGRLTDFMPVGFKEGDKDTHWLIRIVDVSRGAMRFKMECRPAFNFARDAHDTAVKEHGACFYSRGLSLALSSRVPMRADGGTVRAEFSLSEGQRAVFALRQAEPGTGCVSSIGGDEVAALFQETVQFWHRWLSRCTYEGRWREMVHRSALILKLLTFEPTGAIVAAPTCSLPERIGGDRNWDYRFTWLRDAAFTLYALMRIGFTEEAMSFMNWLDARCQEIKPDIPLQIMYGIDGRHDLTERTLDHLKGYKGSAPVRIGNGAFNQLQLDIYGELMDSVYLYNKHASPISDRQWNQLRYLTNWVCNEWHKPDAGIWEVRGAGQHFVYSKLMCWVALDRALRLADKRSFPADRDRWLKTRDQIYEELMSKGWNEECQAFTQAYGSPRLDAANLMMPLVFFLAPNDPRMLKTLDAIGRSPSHGGLHTDSLVYRYDRGGDAGHEEGSFNICTFWLVEAMTRAARHDPARLEDARRIFEQMLGYANHVGLFAEQTGPRGEALGNFPQAFTHLSLISAAFNLDRALGEGK